jgi:hypothetical protein
MNPYTNIEVTQEYIIREFDDAIDVIELMWHRDNEDRLVEALHDTDWLIQIDNELPITLNKPIFIPRHQYHRVIKGNGKLRVKINKLNETNR